MSHAHRLSTLGARAACALGVLLVTGAAVAASAPPASATAPGQGEIGVRPAHSDPADPATQNYLKPRIAAGGTARDAVVVTNGSSDSIDVVVSPVDGLTATTSGAVYANRETPVRKAGMWVSPAVSTLHMAAHASVTVDFTVHVPADASAGDHLAGMAFENAHPTTGGGSFAITQVLRTVIGVEVVVPGAAVFHPALTSLALRLVDGTHIGAVIVGLRNDGLALGKPILNIVLDGPGGLHVSDTRQLDTVLPGDSILYPFAWRYELPAGDYTVTATLTGGGTDATLTQHVHLTGLLAGFATLPRAPATAKAAAANHAGANTKTGLPIGLLAGVAAATGGFGLVVGALVRRRTRRPKGAPTVPANSNLGST